MKFISIIIALAASSAANRTFYSAEKDVTCTGADNGDINCEPGHIDEAPILNTSHNELADSDVSNVEKRLTCGINIEGVDACLAHCFVLDYCNSYCDDVGTCNCRCKDSFPYLCINTSCN